MKVGRLLLAFFLTLTLSKTFSQQIDTALARVYYKFKYQYDTLQPSKVYEEDMVLFLGKKATEYTSNVNLLRDSSLKNEMTEGKDKWQIVAEGRKAGSPTSYFYYPQEEHFLVVERLLRTYCYQADVPVLNWIIKEDTLNIGGLRCQKATGIWKGRTYEAWFCRDIPCSYGPWKLVGLPGLVVQAADKKGEVTFEFGGIEKISQQAPLIMIPPKAINTTEEKFKKLKKLSDEDPIAFIKSTMGISLIPQNKPGVSPPTVKKPNNPIEMVAN